MSLYEKTRLGIEQAITRKKESGEYRPVTLSIYKYHMITALKYLGVHRMKNLSEVKVGDVEDYVKHVLKESPTSVSQVKNAMRMLNEINSELKIPSESFYIDFFKNKKNTLPKELGSGLTDKEIVKKINGMRKSKLKTAFKVMCSTGLRVEEIAKLETCDFEILDDRRFKVLVREGKGGKSGEVVSTSNAKLVGDLKLLLEESKTGNRVFYSKSKLQDEAGKRGFHCHDLRRIYSRNKYNSNRYDGLNKKKALTDTKNNLRQKKISTTKHYLRSGKSGIEI